VRAAFARGLVVSSFNQDQRGWIVGQSTLFCKVNIQKNVCAALPVTGRGTQKAQNGRKKRKTNQGSFFYAFCVRFARFVFPEGRLNAIEPQGPGLKCT
jgi:hypothetical protein